MTRPARPSPRRAVPAVAALAALAAVAAVAAVAALARHGAAQPVRPAPGVAPAPLDTAAIDAFVRGVLAADAVPGAAVAIVRDGRIAYRRGYGNDGHGRPVTPRTGFVLGSMSKAFAALAVLQLVEAGAIDLDAPVQRYLPTFRVADPAASAAITVRHLLLHTSGIPGGAPRARGAGRTLQDHVGALADVRLASAPGERHAYASPNYQLLGAIVERVSGRPYAEYVEGHILAPLAMRHTFTDARRAAAAGLARGHRYWFGVPVAAALPHETDRLPAAALIAGAEDVARFLRFQLGEAGAAGDAVLSPAGLARMHAAGAPGAGFSYGFGWRVGPVHGVPAVHHGGIVPDYRGKMVLVPGQRAGVVVLTNVSSALPFPVAPTSHRLADALAAHLAGQPLADRGPTHRTAHLLASAGAALVLGLQVAGLVGVGRWRARRATWSHARVLRSVGLGLLWPVAVVVGVPLAIGMPWAVLARGAPDMAAFLAASVALDLLTAGARARRAEPPAAPRPVPATA